MTGKRAVQLGALVAGLTAAVACPVWSDPYIIADVFSLTNTGQAPLPPNLNLGELRPADGLYLIPFYVRFQYMPDNFTAWGIQVYTDNDPNNTFVAPDGVYGGLRGQTDPTKKLPLYWQVYPDVRANTTEAGALAFYPETLRYWGRVRDRSDEDIVNSWLNPANLQARTIVGYQGLGDYPSGGRPQSQPPVYFFMGMDVSGATNQTYGTTVHVDLYNLGLDISTGGYATPNPFTPTRGQKTNFNFFLKNANSNYVIRIFTVRGRLIRTITDVREWDGRNDAGQLVEGGLYVYQIEADQKRVSGTVVLIK